MESKLCIHTGSMISDCYLIPIHHIYRDIVSSLLAGILLFSYLPSFIKKKIQLYMWCFTWFHTYLFRMPVAILTLTACKWWPTCKINMSEINQNITGKNAIQICNCILDADQCFLKKKLSRTENPWCHSNSELAMPHSICHLFNRGADLEC